MKSINLLGLAIVSLARAGKATSDPFYTNGILKAEVSQHAKDLSSKPDWENPIFLDSYKNGLLPNKILTTFKSPNFVGNTPPGITTFMASQVFLSGERKDGYVYPLFLKHAIRSFDGRNKNIVVEDICANSKDGKQCAEGYKKVTVKKNTIDCEVNKTVEEAVTTTKKTTSSGEVIKGPTTRTTSTGEVLETENP